MGIASELNFSVAFDLAASPCFFSLADITNYAGEGISNANVKGNFVITGPTGAIYSNASWVTPDLTLNVSTVFSDVSIPLNGDGAPYPGDYTFIYTIQVTGGVQDGIYSLTKIITYSYVHPTVVIDFNNNPYLTFLSCRDITQYLIDGVSPAITEVFKLIFPDLSGIEDLITSQKYMAITNPYYVNGVYRSTILSDLVYTFETYSVHDIVEGNNTITVTDTINIQSIYCCLKNLNNEVQRLKAVDPTLYGQKLATLTYATSLLELFNQAVQFGQYPQADSYIAQIYSITGCTPGCSCGNLTKPAIQPYWLTTNTPGSSESEFEIGDFKATTRSVLNANWIFAVAQLVLITTYPELYAVYGTAFNDGSEPGGYFRIPDTRGRSLIGEGTGTGLINRVFGQKYGSESVTAAHSHTITNLSVNGNVTIPSLVVNVTALLGTAAAGTTGVTSLSIQGNGATLNPTFSGTASSPITYSPTGDVTITNIVLSSHNISSLTVSGDTDTQALTITGSGTVTSNTKSGVAVTPAACDNGGSEPLVSVARCSGMTVDDFTVDIAATAIASALSISPNPHSHSITNLPVSGSIPDHTFVSGTASFTATNSLNVTVTPAGTVSIGANTIAATLSLSPNGHDHSIPTRAVTGTGSGNTTATTQAATLTGSGSTDSASPLVEVLHPVLTVRFAIKVK